MVKILRLLAQCSIKLTKKTQIEEMAKASELEAKNHAHASFLKKVLLIRKLMGTK